jgi:hypothetical protein
MKRENKNLHTTKPAPDFANLKRIDPDRIHAPPPLPPLQEQEPDLGPMGTAKVARGRTVHVPTGVKHVVGSRPYDAGGGTVVHRDITAVEFHSAGPGETVTLPVSEIERLTTLGFLQPIDDQPTRRGNGKGEVNTRVSPSAGSRGF